MKPVMGVMLGLLALALFCSPAAKAWNCPSGQIRQQAPAGTSPSTPSYDVVEGIAFICVPANQATGGSNTNTNSNTNSNSNSNKNTNSSSSSATGGSVKNSGNSSSTSTATGGTGIGIGGSASAQGGSVKDSGNSSISNSGNSSSTVRDSGNSTAIAQGGKGGNANQHQSQSQGQSQSTSSEANGNGVGNGDNSNNTYVPRETATAVAPIVPATVSCFKGIGVGMQGPAFGASFGGGKIDQTCSALEVARSFAASGNRVAYCKMMLTIKSVQNAGVTMDVCLGVEPKK